MKSFKIQTVGKCLAVVIGFYFLLFNVVFADGSADIDDLLKPGSSPPDSQIAAMTNITELKKLEGQVTAKMTAVPTEVGTKVDGSKEMNSIREEVREKEKLSEKTGKDEMNDTDWNGIRNGIQKMREARMERLISIQKLIFKSPTWELLKNSKDGIVNYDGTKNSTGTGKDSNGAVPYGGNSNFFKGQTASAESQNADAKALAAQQRAGSSDLAGGNLHLDNSKTIPDPVAVPPTQQVTPGLWDRISGLWGGSK